MLYKEDKVFTKEEPFSFFAESPLLLKSFECSNWKYAFCCFKIAMSKNIRDPKLNLHASQGPTLEV